MWMSATMPGARHDMSVAQCAASSVLWATLGCHDRCYRLPGRGLVIRVRQRVVISILI